MDRTNYCQKHNVSVLADPKYGPLGKCTDCGTFANLDDGLCEACHMADNGIAVIPTQPPEPTGDFAPQCHECGGTVDDHYRICSQHSGF